MAEANDAVLEPPADDLDLGRPAELEYAGFWSRVAALIVDNAIVTILSLALLIAAGSLGAGALVIANLATLVIAILYWPLLESSERQATIGKQLLGIQVVDANGARLSFVRALLRNLAKILSSLPFGLGFLLAAFTPRKQALHDMITKCLVVRAGPSKFMKAVIATVGALAISAAGGYYYFAEVYLPQMAEDMGRQMEKGMKQAPKRMPAGKPAPGEPRIMTPQEIAEFEKKMAEAKREPAKVAAAPPPAPAPQPIPAAPVPAKPAAAEPKAAPVKPAPAPVAKVTAPKPVAAPAAVTKPEPKPEPKPESKPATVAAAKPKP
ncbi:MAG: RDD family protein, partial [Gammaproteobacteria bacterium]